MALKFLSGHTGSGSSSSVKLFDIRLDNDYIVLRGSEDEAGSAQLTGQLALCLTEPLTITHITLTLDGITHMSYFTNSASSMSGRRIVAKEKGFFQKVWTFKDPGRGREEKLLPDNYLWNFDLIIDGTMPESVEGLKDYYVVYRLKAEIGRRRAKDIVTRKPLRIVRTLGPSALELSHAMSVENVWPNKIEYSISTPSKAVIFGSFLQIDFRLVPLLKGLVIGNVLTQLREEQEFVVDPEWSASALNSGYMKEDRIIVYDSYTIGPDADTQILDETAEGFQFSRFLELPKSLSKCLQDCNVKGIKVRHKLKFNVQLHNPDGHVSELRANLPISLYISENLPLNENNDLVDQTPQAGRAAMQNDVEHSAPPLYGEHHFDQLYSDLDPSGYRTPGAALSNAATPHSLSRQISTENIASLAARASDPGSVSASALSTRLQGLRTSERVSPSNVQEERERTQPSRGDLSRRSSQLQLNGDYSDPYNSVGSGNYSTSQSSYTQTAQPESSDVTRTSSAEDPPTLASGTITPFFSTDHFEDLVKVPSYTTAVRTPAPQTLGSGINLPTYGASMAQLYTDSNASIPSTPPSAHVRESTRPETQTIPSYTSAGQPNRRPRISPQSSQTPDNERLLRLRQLRGVR